MDLLPISRSDIMQAEEINKNFKKINYNFVNHIGFFQHLAPFAIISDVKKISKYMKFTIYFLSIICYNKIRLNTDIDTIFAKGDSL